MSHNAPICLSDLFFSAHFANSLRTLRLRAFKCKGRKGSARSSQRKTSRTRIVGFALLAICVACPTPTVWAETGPSSLPIHYTIALTDLAAHRVHVTITLPPGAAERDLQLPVWNALYQVRDFSQYVNWVRAKNHQGGALPIRLLDKSRWHVSGAANGAEVEYEILAVLPGPYGAELNSRHAFFNLAEILMYPVDQRSAPVQLHFVDVPPNWQIATPLEKSQSGNFTAQNYDRLVDSPVEISAFEEEDFDDGGAHYRVVVDAERGDYDLRKLVPVVRKIVTAATGWMDDRPFSSYLFLYHFPRDSGGGGMEHAYSTAIEVNAHVLVDNPLALADVTAHEFFHLWNVKRIRPQSLEPVDYTKENYTSALWFSEGVTNTAQDYILLRAELLNESQFLHRLAGQIEELEDRPAHLAQSAEESSLDAWLEKYQQYWSPERSISYYNKGDLLGVMLDLAMRDASDDSASLRDLFHWMNRNYAQQGKFFSDADGVRQAAEAVTHADLKSFFANYVAGTEQIPWDGVFNRVGLHLVRQPKTVADLGFSAIRTFGAQPVVTSIRPGTEAERSGLAEGDSILEINNRAASSDFQEKLAQLHPGDTIRLKVQSSGRERTLQWKLGSREEIEFELKDVDNISPQQKARRAAWLKGESQGGTSP
ncbi:MAG TPA: PDZ domain-containing protein [Terriglobales bacterium]|nr:PDZ domain-containing protein [Terriglobales bacterium]